MKILPRRNTRNKTLTPKPLRLKKLMIKQELIKFITEAKVFCLSKKLNITVPDGKICTVKLKSHLQPAHDTNHALLPQPYKSAISSSLVIRAKSVVHISVKRGLRDGRRQDFCFASAPALQ